MLLRRNGVLAALERKLGASSALCTIDPPAPPPGGGGAPPPPGGTPPPPGGGSPPPPGGQPPGGTPPPPAYRPEGLPEHLAGATDKDTLDKVWGAYKGARETLGKAGAVPEKADGYKLEPSDKLKPYVQNFDKDPIYAKTREVFHKAGVTDKQFNAIVGPWLETLVEGGLVSPPIDAKAEFMKLVPASAGALDDAGKAAAAEKRMNANIAWVDGAKAQQTLPQPVAEFLAAQLPDTVGAHHLVEWLRGLNNEPRVALPGGAGGSGMSDADLSARSSDPRGNPNSPKFDRAFAAETDKLYQQRYG